MKPSADFLAQHFINYMFANIIEDKYKHVQRVAAWIGMLALAIHQRADHWQFNHKRQLIYTVGVHSYKVRFTHKLSNGTRGGIVILEVHGNTDGRIKHELGSLADVEEFYLDYVARAELEKSRRAAA